MRDVLLEPDVLPGRCGLQQWVPMQGATRERNGLPERRVPAHLLHALQFRDEPRRRGWWGWRGRLRDWQQRLR